jgi:hypothetical protein
MTHACYLRVLLLTPLAIQEALIKACLPSEATWDDVRSIGLCVWCTNTTVLRQVTENLAKVTFKQTKNAEDCAIYYIALGKKSALQALFKATGNVRLSEFFMNNFSETRWQNAVCTVPYRACREVGRIEHNTDTTLPLHHRPTSGTKECIRSARQATLRAGSGILLIVG